MQHPQSIARRDAASEYRKLVAALASRAARMGSRDAEGAAQETVKRSLANSTSRDAVEYYFREAPPDGRPPEWALEQLLAWLHGVLRFVVREERARAGYRQELPAFDIGAFDVRDPAPDQLDLLIDDQLHTIVRDSLSSLSDHYRTVLTLRTSGLKYTEIAARLGVSENTVATWVRRGTRTATERIRARLDGRPRLSAVADPRD